MLNSIKDANARQGWSLERQPTLVAVSGGRDSMSLFRAFLELRYEFAVAHVNFGLRGTESDDDEQFVREQCEKVGVSIHVCHAGNIKKLRGESTQMWARRVRYDFFNRIMDLHGYSWLATAHHADDNLEHFLIYLYRNQMDVAWRGIMEQNQRIIRPLLRIPSSEIQSFCEGKDLKWREDSSNQSMNYMRNVIRNGILKKLDNSPQLMEEFSFISQEISGVQIQKENEVSARWPEEKIKTHGWEIPKGEYPQHRSHLRPKLLSIGFFPSQIKQALREENSKVGAEWVSKKGYKMVLGRDEIIHVFKQPEALEWSLKEGMIKHFDGYQLELKKRTMFNSDAFIVIEIPADIPIERLYVTNQWQGKRIVLKNGQKQKISDFITNNKWTPSEKAMILLLESKDSVFFVGSALRSMEHASGDWVLVKSFC